MGQTIWIGVEVVTVSKTPRNAPCPCGSGKKYKKCCMKADLVKSAPVISKPIPGETRHNQLRLLDMRRITGRMGAKRAKRVQKMWTPHRVSGMETERILAELKRLGVTVDEETFRPLTEGRDAGWQIGMLWVGEIGRRLSDTDADLPHLAATNLWRRWVPERICVEAIDDWMQEGYAMQGVKPDRDVAEHWLGLWEVLRVQWVPGTRTTGELDRRLSCTQHPGNWLQDWCISLMNAGIDDEVMAQRGADALAQVREAFVEESASWLGGFDEDRAQLLFSAGRRDLAEPILRRLIDAGAGGPTPYMRLAEGLTDGGRGSEQDLQECIELLRKAKARYDDAAEFGVVDLLAALETRLSKHSWS